MGIGTTPEVHVTVISNEGGTGDIVMETSPGIRLPGEPMQRTVEFPPAHAPEGHPPAERPARHHVYRQPVAYHVTLAPGENPRPRVDRN